jgi:UPF0716 protein FxsA
MRLAVLLFLVALPFLEIGLLIKLGGVIGGWQTFAIVIGTAILGGALIVQNGFNSAVRVQQSVQRGELPLAPMMDSALVVTSGVLLITPGPIGDCLGLVLLIPPLRRFLIARMSNRFFGPGEVGAAQARSGSQEDPAQAARPAGDGPIIEGEFQRLGERPMGDTQRPDERR